jgi:hypothetical protein
MVMENPNPCSEDHLYLTLSTDASVLHYEFIWSFVSANLLQILKIDLPFDPNFVA